MAQLESGIFNPKWAKRAVTIAFDKKNYNPYEMKVMMNTVSLKPIKRGKTVNGHMVYTFREHKGKTVEHVDKQLHTKTTYPAPRQKKK